MESINKPLIQKKVLLDLMSPLVHENSEFPVPIDTLSFITNQGYYLIKELISSARAYKYQCNDHKLRLEHVVIAMNESKWIFHGGSISSKIEIPMKRRDFFTQDKINIEGCFKGHWLCIDGFQPVTVFNPVETIRLEAMETALLKQPSHKRPKCVCDSKTMRLINNITAYKIKPTDSNMITAEEQLFYVELTKTLVGVNDSKRMEALTSLSSEPVVSSIMPPLVVFISEGTRENIASCNFPILIYIIRMIHALVRNPNVYVEQYLHELLPCVLSCIVTKEVCSARDFRNQWALRDFAVTTMKLIVRGFDSEINQVKKRVCKVLEKVLKSQNSSIPACYGATYGLLALGHDVVNTHLIPHVAYVTDRVSALADSAYPDSLERLAGDKYIDFFKTKMAEEIIQNVAKDMELEYLSKLGRFGIGVAAYIREQRTHVVR